MAQNFQQYRCNSGVGETSYVIYDCCEVNDGQWQWVAEIPTGQTGAGCANQYPSSKCSFNTIVYSSDGKALSDICSSWPTE